MESQVQGGGRGCHISAAPCPHPPGGTCGLSARLLCPEAQANTWAACRGSNHDPQSGTEGKEQDAVTRDTCPGTQNTLNANCHEGA